VRILYVCTANICRSPSAEAQLRRAGLAGVEVASAGTHAVHGAPCCALAPLLAGVDHPSQPLAAEFVGTADLVLTAAREHQAVVLTLDPDARVKTFTIRQAGRLAKWLLDQGIVEAAGQRAITPEGWAGRFEEGDPRQYVMPLPPEPERGAWLVAELDAARGFAPAPPVPERRRRRDPEPPHPDDVPDPHVLGAGWHGPAAEQIVAATEPLVAVLRQLR
jgi:protein-tyrosine-phosphatase